LNAITRTVATTQVFIVLDFHMFAFKKAISAIGLSKCVLGGHFWLLYHVQPDLFHKVLILYIFYNVIRTGMYDFYKKGKHKGPLPTTT